MRNTLRLFGCALLPAFLVCGCADTGASTVGGGLLGAGVGAIIGHAFHCTGAGALIGAGTGAIAGNSIAHAEQDKQYQAQVAAREKVLSLEDIAYMAQNHTSDALIVNQIRATGAIYHLTAEQITWLTQRGVSDAVIAEMQSTAFRPAGRVVYVEPSAAVGVGFTYGRRW